MTNSYRVHFFHLVWSTKNRKKYLQPKIQETLYPYMGGIIRKSEGSLIEIGGMPDHVHLLVEISNLDRHASLIRNTKASSTAWLKKEFRECTDFAWQDGYGSFAVSTSLIDNVRDYIRNQERHHATQSYESEFLKLLELNKVSFDPRYVF